MPAENIKTLTHQKKEIYRGKHFAFTTEDVTLPNGARAEMAMVRHPGSTAIVPFLDDDTVILIRQYRHAISRFIYEIPSGTMNPGETDPQTCALRELEEETGYRANTLIDLGQIYILPSYSDEKIHLYLAKQLTQSQQHLDDDEIIFIEKFPLMQAMQMIDNGIIIDALTILALQRAWFTTNHSSLKKRK